MGINSVDDKFVYQIHSMNLEDVIYINCLVLDRIQTYLGFSETKEILQSVITYSCVKGALNNYDPLLVEMEKLGYEIGKKKRYQELADKISPRSITFTESEQKCIEGYLRFKKQAEKLKNS